MSKHFKTELIDEYMLKHHLTQKEFCVKCGISEYALRKIYKQDGSVKVSRILNVIFVVGILFSEFAS